MMYTNILLPSLHLRMSVIFGDRYLTDGGRRQVNATTDAYWRWCELTTKHLHENFQHDIFFECTTNRQQIVKWKTTKKPASAGFLEREVDTYLDELLEDSEVSYTNNLETQWLVDWDNDRDSKTSAPQTAKPHSNRNQ